MYTMDFTSRSGVSTMVRMLTVRESLLQAAREIVVAGDAGGSHLGDVASGPGVSRQTLYNEFGGKDGLAQALSLAETEWFLARTQERLHEHPGQPGAGICGGGRV